MPRTLTMTEARECLTRLPEELASDLEPGALTVTPHGEPVLAVLPYDFYQSLMETLEIMGDHDGLNVIREGLADVETGRTVSLAEAQSRLGL